MTTNDLVAQAVAEWQAKEEHLVATKASWAKIKTLVLKMSHEEYVQYREQTGDPVTHTGE